MEYKILNKVTSPADVKKLNKNEIKILCDEIRDCLISTVSKNGGHLASNLGVVELTVALHRVFNSPTDAIIFDVGHQSYTHKLLTGRFKDFSTLRTENGISGFMSPEESEHDYCISGHSSSSVSVAYGIYKAKALSGEEGTAVAVIGDGAITGGMAYEALNNAGANKSKFVVVLNDNKMSISKNVGAMARYLNRIRSKKSYHSFKNRLNVFLGKTKFGRLIRRKLFSSKTMLKNAIYHSNIFEGLGFNYFGPVDGHDVKAVENLLNIAVEQNRPSLVHVVTVKGKGYQFAEANPNKYHGVASFDIDEGTNQQQTEDYSSVFGKKLCELAKENKNVCAVTAAMTSGTGLSEFSITFKERFFDVGIAEEHAVAFCGGLAKGGQKPFFAVYSSFLQRAYDQLVHDIAIAKLPIKLCVDRAGIVGEDGQTHQGMFDVSFLTSIPGFTVYSPASYSELRGVMDEILNDNTPVAVRYPRGKQGENAVFGYTGKEFDTFFAGKENLIITYGRISANAYAAAQKDGNITFIKLNKIYPFSKTLIENVMQYKKVFIFEEGICEGSVAEKLSTKLLENNFLGNVEIFAAENTFVKHGKTEELLKQLKLDTNSMLEIIGGR